jgi:dihydropteroate synthase
MAIVNRTPDSFYRPGATWDHQKALDRAHEIVAEGADILDVGGVPAKPGGDVDVAEEIRRTVPFIEAVRAAYPELVISADTWRHEVGRAACEAGADLLTDTWGGWDPELAEVAAEFGVGLVCSHAGGLPPRTRPFRVAYTDVMRGRPGQDRHRPGPRLRQEHLAIAGDHPPPGRDDRDRLAGPDVGLA